MGTTKVNMVKVLGISGGIIISVLIYAHSQGVFEGAVSAVVPDIKELKEVSAVHTKDIAVLQSEVPTMKKDIEEIKTGQKGFHAEQRKHNTKQSERMIRVLIKLGVEEL